MLSDQTHPWRVVLLLGLALLFGGCLSRSRTALPPPSFPVEPVAETPAPSVAELPVETPPAVALETPAAPVAPPARVLDPAAAPVVALLAQQLRIAPEAIEVVQVARADWPDGCLGLPAEGELCSMAITPGFAVSLVTSDQRYEFRTDESGRRIRLAFAPRAETGEALVTWRDAASFDVLLIGTQRVAFGLRGRPLLVAPLPAPERAQELVGFLSRFAPFYARTPAGEITFRGVGTATASALDQRQIASWAALVSSEAKEGHDTRVLERTFVWRRTGGIAGFCDEVVVSRAGFAAAFSCRTPAAEPTAIVPLDPSEIAELYRWVDTLASFEWNSQDDGATADGLTIELKLTGQGSRRAAEADLARMQEVANALVRRLVSAVSAPPQ